MAASRMRTKPYGGSLVWAWKSGSARCRSKTVRGRPNPVSKPPAHHRQELPFTCSVRPTGGDPVALRRALARWLIAADELAPAQPAAGVEGGEPGQEGTTS
jgi:hypothetical protein